MRTVLPPKAKLIPKQAKLAFRGAIFDVYQWPQQLFNGETATFEMLKRPDSLATIAVKDNKLVVLDEQQAGHQRFLSLPEGRHDHAGETELEGAQRELLEETGMTFSSWKLVNVVQIHPKIEYFGYLYVATEFRNQAVQKLDGGEKIRVELWDFEAVKARANEFRFLPPLLLAANSLDELTSLPEYRA